MIAISNALLRLRASALCSILLLAPASASFAQEYRGRIQGTVLDPAQASVPSARVTLTNLGTGVSSKAVTNTAGHYIFDLTEPGHYSLSIVANGFGEFRAPSVLLQQGGDVTVDASLSIGSVAQELKVSAAAAQIQFNSPKLETTIDNQIASNVPQFFRHPFLLGKLDPGVVQSETRLESQPYHSNTDSTNTVGGIRGMDLLVDGAPVGLGTYTGYVPSPDMVSEVNVRVNSVDAEFGQSTGAAISVSMKSGTNEMHGNAFYQGVYPWMNAILDRVNRTPNVQRRHMFGGTLGQALRKNRWFNFVGFEGWQLTDPQTLSGELPTDAERRGDYSHSLNQQGAPRAIYDPSSTMTSPDGATVTRTPFSNNIIPQSTISHVAAAYAAALPEPNQPGVGPYHANNYVVPLPLATPYRNFSDRTDYVINDRFRYTGRVSLFRTPITAPNPTGSDLAWMSDRSTLRDATQIANGLSWIASPATVVDANFAYYGYYDDANPHSDFKGYDTLWSNSTWYKPLFDSGVLPTAPPGMQITQADGASIMSAYSNGIGANGPYYKKHQWQDFETLKIAHQSGAHYLKAGAESRATRSSQVPQTNYPYFSFNAAPTASTYVNPDTRQSGDGFASFLTGAITGGQMPVMVGTNLYFRTFGVYFNDDWKVNRRLTLTLGLRWEYEQPFREAQNRLAKGPDLTVPIPEFQGANAPAMPATVLKYYQGGWTFNGAYRWTENNDPGQWDGGLGTLSPRLGFALRVDDKTSLRAGYGRYVAPWTLSSNATQGNYYGYSLQTAAPAPVLGLSQMSLDNPFPVNSYPIQPVLGKSLGSYTGFGDSLSWFAEERPRQYVNRINVSVQRQVAFGLVADATYFINSFNNPASRNINQTDPSIGYTYKSAINQSVPNPFYHLLPADKFPGPLRNQPNVSLTSLMVPYPQYGSLTVTDYENNSRTFFQQAAVRVRKTYGYGLTFLAGYAYTRSKTQVYYDDVATYLQQRTWQTDTNPRHRFTFGGTWEIPIGHKRQFLHDVPRALDAIVGGWNVSPVITWRSGDILSFPGLIVTGDPHISNPGPGAWFNTSVFAQLPAYTRRTNPVVYSGITGPRYFNIDASLLKSFRIKERFSTQFRVDVFNVPNSMTWNDPSTSITSTYFGKSSGQLLANGIGVGRQTQLGLRLSF